MPADNKDDDPVTFNVFNAFQKEIFERFDAMQKQLDEGRAEREEDRKAREEERKAQEKERKAREEDRKAREEERKAQEEERKAREEEQKKREEVQNEIWKELGEYNLTGAIKKTILLHYGKFFCNYLHDFHLFHAKIDYIYTQQCIWMPYTTRRLTDSVIG
jgi:flagellar biosynthesis GTPase FlhF